jgi:hypothetical protein
MNKKTKIIIMLSTLIVLTVVFVNSQIACCRVNSGTTDSVCSGVTRVRVVNSNVLDVFIPAGSSSELSSFLTHSTSFPGVTATSVACCDNAQCSSPTPFCDTLNICRECLTTPNCLAPYLCSMSTKTCVECSDIMPIGHGCGLSIYEFCPYSMLCENEECCRLGDFAHPDCPSIVCDSCIPRTCASAGFQCGSHSDLCGGTINCGSCVFPESCIGGQCQGMVQICNVPQDCMNQYPDCTLFMDCLEGACCSMGFPEWYDPCPPACAPI